MWIHHGETVIVNDKDEEEYDDETLESLSQYSAELDARMDPEFGNEQGGIDIDVFLEPLMQEMERLWRHGEPMYDAFRKEDFICRAIIFVTTNDYPALFALSGQIKGKMGCLDGTIWVYLDASKKIVYLRNQRFLKTSHKYRSKLFFRFYDNTSKIESPLERRHNGEHMYRMVKNICVIYGKKNLDGTNRDRSTPPVEGVPFKK